MCALAVALQSSDRTLNPGMEPANNPCPSSRNSGKESEYQSWDYLKGAGPSGAERYNDPLNKKAFKPGWDSIKHYASIKPDEPRLQWEQTKVLAQQAAQKLRSQRLHEKNQFNRFNPITGQALKSDGTWTPANDPWQHQKSTSKLALPDIAAAHVTGSRAAHNAAAYGMRKERLHDDGLVIKRSGGTVADALQWSG